MNKTTFDLVLDFVLAREGGYVNSPADRGGETNLGITANTLRVAQTAGIVDSALTVRALTRETAAPVYRELYWGPVHAEGRGYDMALVLFDGAVNHGVRASIRLAQRGLNALGAGLAEDGIWGRRTEEAVVLAEAYYPVGACLAIIQKRTEFYEAIVAARPSQRVFLAGWKNRMTALRSEVTFS